MGVRKVVTRSGRGIRGYFPSKKMGRMIAWESQLERDAIFLLEFTPRVLRYHEQPAKVYFCQENEQRLYIPDFAVELVDERVMHIEVKPESKLRKPDLQKRFEAITAHYSRSDIGFSILTEKIIRKEPQLTNLKLLAYHQPDSSSEPTVIASMQKLALLPAQTIAGATAVLGDVRLVYQLLAANKFNCEMNEPIKPETHIYSTQLGGSHDAIFL